MSLNPAEFPIYKNKILRQLAKTKTKDGAITAPGYVSFGCYGSTYRKDIHRVPDFILEQDSSKWNPIYGMILMNINVPPTVCYGVTTYFQDDAQIYTYQGKEPEWNQQNQE